MSINGIWGGCEGALVEASRVLRPDGMIGISFWETGTPNDMRGCFKAYARHSPPLAWLSRCWPMVDST